MVLWEQKYPQTMLEEGNIGVRQAGRRAGHWPRGTNLAMACGIPWAVRLRAGVQRLHSFTFPVTRSVLLLGLAQSSPLLKTLI